MPRPRTLDPLCLSSPSLTGDPTNAMASRPRYAIAVTSAPVSCVMRARSSSRLNLNTGHSDLCTRLPIAHYHRASADFAVTIGVWVSLCRLQRIPGHDVERNPGPQLCARPHRCPSRDGYERPTPTPLLATRTLTPLPRSQMAYPQQLTHT